MTTSLLCRFYRAKEDVLGWEPRKLYIIADFMMVDKVLVPRVSCAAQGDASSRARADDAGLLWDHRP